MHARLADIELKHLAGNITLRSSIKEQITGAVDYHFRNQPRHCQKRKTPQKSKARS
jgi:hypothetical protein